MNTNVSENALSKHRENGVIKAHREIIWFGEYGQWHVE
jgi:hypothetical protein